MSHIGNAGAFLAANAVQLLPPKVDTGTTGSGVDITDYEGVGIVSVQTGAAAGSGIMNVTIQDSADNSSFAAVANFASSGVMPNTSGSNQAQAAALDLSACRRYIRAVTTLVSGTSLIIGASFHAVKKATG